MIHLFACAACAVIALHAISAFAQAPSAVYGAQPVAASGSSVSTVGPTSFRYPEMGGQPGSTLRVREVAVPGGVGTMAPSPVPMTDTRASVEKYQRCQRVGTREATDNANMRGRIAQCLAEFDARRRAGQ